MNYENKISMLFLLVVTGLSGHVLAHGNVIPQRQIAQLCRQSLMAMSLKMAGCLETHIEALWKTKTKVIKFGESAYANNCAGCTACTRSLAE